jgi:hypothetical protein
MSRVIRYTSDQPTGRCGSWPNRPFSGPREASHWCETNAALIPAMQLAGIRTHGNDQGWKYESEGDK